MFFISVQGNYCILQIITYKFVIFSVMQHFLYYMTIKTVFIKEDYVKSNKNSLLFIIFV